jgi:hypothetical protein
MRIVRATAKLGIKLTWCFNVGVGDLFINLFWQVL